MSLAWKHCLMMGAVAAFLVGCQGPAPEPEPAPPQKAALTTASATPRVADSEASGTPQAAAVPAGLKSTLTHGSAPATAPLESEQSEATPQQAEVLKAIAGSLKGESAEAYHERGTMYLMMGEEESLADAYRLAAADFGKAVAIDPSMMGGYNNRAMAYSRLGEHEKALRDFQSAIKIDPKNAGLHMRHASVLSKLGRDQEAVKVYAQAYALGDVDCLFNRGNAYMRLGKNDLARQDFETVIKKSQNPQIVEAAKMNLEANQ